MMSPYKNLLGAAKAYMESTSVLKFLLYAYIAVFAIGGGLYVFGSFVFAGGFFITIGRLMMFAGLILTLIKEDMMTLAITSCALALGSLVVWIYALVSRPYLGYGGYFTFEPLLYFLIFGGIATLVFIKSEQFKQMREVSRVKTQTPVVTCPRCGGYIPVTAGFCPSCGVQNPAYAQYAAPVAPAQPRQAPAQPSRQAPAQAPQAAPVAAPVTAPQATQAAPVTAPEPPQAAPVQSAPEVAAVITCSSCGATVPQGAAFCGACGAKV